jgi:sirohydrochlorin cobaltochelatase
MSAAQTTLGILMFAHGARDPSWSRPFEQARSRLQALMAGRIEPEHICLAFLEFMSPTLIEAGLQLAQAGCQRVHVVPLFLGTGGHVRKDLPELMAKLQAQAPQVDWQLTASVGDTEVLVLALAEATAQLAGLHPAAPGASA